MFSNMRIVGELGAFVNGKIGSFAALVVANIKQMHFSFHKSINILLGQTTEDIKQIAEWQRVLRVH